ncbi:MAG TPA: hypothetical protein ENL20_12055 [Candidatus Cloacimonetes bacterium]|nr:hypothetical protein [Candidatus Cloacimonadota bacterium]
MKFIRTVVIILSILALTNCSNKKQGNDKDQIIFHVDSLLLDSTYTNSKLEIDFKPPKNWKVISDELMESIKANTETISDSINIDLQKVFMNKDISGFCFISTFEENYHSRNFVKDYILEIKKKNSEKSIKEGNFLYNDFKIMQLSIFDQDNINLKLIIQSQKQKTFLIDYIIPMKFYEDNLRAIESSIGSLSNKEKEGEKK